MSHYKKDISTDPVLHVYKGEWGLPSIDFECLRVLCLVKFTRCPIKVETNGNPLLSGNGKLPYLQVGKKVLNGYLNIKNFLIEMGYPINGALEKEQDDMSTAYVSWIFKSMHGYFHYTLHGCPNNYESTNALYAKRTPFPLCFYYPGTYRKEANNIVSVLGGFDFLEPIEKHETKNLSMQAQICANIISSKLDKVNWFFGDEFSEIDAIVYSYFSILSKIKLENNPLYHHINACPNLVRFINRISKDIFKDEYCKSIKIDKQITYNKLSERYLPNPESRAQIFGGIVAFVAICAYSFWRGISPKLLSNRGRSFTPINNDEIVYDKDDEHDNIF